MPNPVIAAITLFTAAAISALAVPRIIKFAERYGLLQGPGEARRVHTYPLPRIGGIAMFLGFTVAVAVTFVLPVERFSEEVERITLVLVGAMVIVVVMFYDDVIGIGPLGKLAAQAGVALLMILPRLRHEQAGIVIEQFNVPLVETIHLPLLPAFAFTAFWVVGMMNVLNWSDGLDGLAATIALSASTVLFLHTFFWPRGNPQFTISLLAIALAGAIIGFLPANWHPARIIMGDTGAMFLGFALATTSIIGGAKIATALLALCVPIVDMAWVIVNRMVHRRSPLRPDRGHLHHRLLDAGWSQQQIVVAFGAITLGGGGVGLLLPTRELKLIALVAIGVGVLTAIAALARTGPRMRSKSGEAPSSIES